MDSKLGSASDTGEAGSSAPRDFAEDPLEAHPCFALFSEPGQALLRSSSQWVPYRPRRTLLRGDQKADEVLWLLSGAVRVVHRVGERAVSVELLGAPALLGVDRLAQTPLPEEVVSTVVFSHVLRIPHATFSSLLATEPRFATAVVWELARRLRTCCGNASHMALQDLDARLCRLLLDYASLDGRELGPTASLQMRLSQASLAHDLGVSRRSIVRALERLRSAKLVCKVEGRYVIQDTASLRMRAQAFSPRRARPTPAVPTRESGQNVDRRAEEEG